MEGDILMKLNPECVRDILFTVEDKTDSEHYIDYPYELPECELLLKYSEEEVRYHINQCDMSALIIVNGKDMDGNMSIMDLTPAGHEFIADIRNDTVWNNVKEKSSKIGVSSLRAIRDIAVGVVSELIKTQF
jgi:hypothetical protein